MLDLRQVNQHLFRLAKRLWTISNSLKLAAFVVGVVGVFASRPYPYLPQAITLLVALSELIQWRSDVIKSRSEFLLRSLDLCTSFRKDLSESDKREIISSLPRKLRKKYEGSIADTYFSSDESPGPRRAVENLVESAWYTKKQTEKMFGICILLIAVVLIISVAALIVTNRELANVSAREGVSKVVTSWLLLIFSLGLVKNAWLYLKMFLRCQKTETMGDHMLSGEITEPDALKQWYEYQLARSSAPLLPDSLWKLMRPSLEDGWTGSRGVGS